MLTSPETPLKLLERLSADESLSTRVESALRTSGYLELQRVRVVAFDGRVLLGGRLRTYFLKQMACALALSVPGVASIDDELEVE